MKQKSDCDRSAACVCNSIQNLKGIKKYLKQNMCFCCIFPMANRCAAFQAVNLSMDDTVVRLPFRVPIAVNVLPSCSF